MTRQLNYFSLKYEQLAFWRGQDSS